MKVPHLLCRENIMTISKYRLLKVLPGLLSVNIEIRFCKTNIFCYFEKKKNKTKQKKKTTKNGWVYIV